MPSIFTTGPQSPNNKPIHQSNSPIPDLEQVKTEIKSLKKNVKRLLIASAVARAILSVVFSVGIISGLTLLIAGLVLPPTAPAAAALLIAGVHTIFISTSSGTVSGLILLLTDFGVGRMVSKTKTLENILEHKKTESQDLALKKEEELSKIVTQKYSEYLDLEIAFPDEKTVEKATSLLQKKIELNIADNNHTKAKNSWVNLYSRSPNSLPFEPSFDDLDDILTNQEITLTCPEGKIRETLSEKAKKINLTIQFEE